MTAKRVFLRHPSDIPVHVELEHVAADHQDYLNNISSGGMSFKSNQVLAKGAYVRIRIPFVEPVFEASGKVVWCEKGNNCFDIGIEFVFMEDGFRARMVEQVCHIEQYKLEVFEKQGRRLSGEQAALEWIEKYGAFFPSFREGD